MTSLPIGACFFHIWLEFFIGHFYYVCTYKDPRFSVPFRPSSLFAFQVPKTGVIFHQSAFCFWAANYCWIASVFLSIKMFYNWIVLRIKWNSINAWHIVASSIFYWGLFSLTLGSLHSFSTLRVIWLKHPSVCGTPYDTSLREWQFSTKVRKSKLPSLDMRCPA